MATVDATRRGGSGCVDLTLLLQHHFVDRCPFRNDTFLQLLLFLVVQGVFVDFLPGRPALHANILEIADHGADAAGALQKLLHQVFAPEGRLLHFGLLETVDGDVDAQARLVDCPPNVLLDEVLGGLLPALEVRIDLLCILLEILHPEILQRCLAFDLALAVLLLNQREQLLVLASVEQEVKSLFVHHVFEELSDAVVRRQELFLLLKHSQEEKVFQSELLFGCHELAVVGLEQENVRVEQEHVDEN